VITVLNGVVLASISRVSTTPCRETMGENGNQGAVPNSEKIFFVPRFERPRTEIGEIGGAKAPALEPEKFTI